MSASQQQLMSSVKLASLGARVQPLQRWLSRVPLSVWQTLVRAVLVFWLAYVLAQVVWMLTPTPRIPVASINSLAITAAPQSSSDKPNVDINQLKQLTPFGNPAAESVKVQTLNPEQEAVDTQLNLQLSGLVYSNDEKVARAVIVSNSRQEVYAVGDPIADTNNATLAKILSDRVIINNNGKMEALWLFKDDPNAPKISQPYVASTPYNNTYNEQPPVYTSEPIQAATPSADQNPVVQMGTTLSDVVAMSIERKEGQIIGYKIRPGRNAELFNNLGLQTDDVVTAVNGMPLNNPGKIMEIYRSMGSATSANLQILRNGSTVNLDISLNL